MSDRAKTKKWKLNCAGSENNETADRLSGFACRMSAVLTTEMAVGESKVSLATPREVV